MFLVFLIHALITLGRIYNKTAVSCLRIKVPENLTRDDLQVSQ